MHTFSYLTYTYMQGGKGKIEEFDNVWRAANSQFQKDVGNMKPVDLSSIIMEEALEEAKMKAEAAMRADGLLQGSRYVCAYAYMLRMHVCMYACMHACVGNVRREAKGGVCADAVAQGPLSA